MLGTLISQVRVGVLLSDESGECHLVGRDDLGRILTSSRMRMLGGFLVDERAAASCVSAGGDDVDVVVGGFRTCTLVWTSGSLGGSLSTGLVNC